VSILTKIIGTPSIGKMLLKSLKKRAFDSFQIPLESVLEKQNKMLEAKLKKIERTAIGKKLGLRKGVKFEELPITDYHFYEPFFNNPTMDAFLHPVNEYLKVRTSGTSGSEKWFMLHKESFPKMFRETGLPFLMSLFHDGEKITLEYGDTLFVNMAPRPFIGGLHISMTKGGYGLINIVPNINLSYKEKTQYFIDNYKDIDGAVMLASTLISQIIPAISKPVKLKGLSVFDSGIAEIYKKEIEEFCGVPPKSAYGSTEIGFTAGIPSIQYPLGFILDWRRGFFEFLPVKKGSVETVEPLRLNEVRLGEVYEVIYTSLDGELTRYRTRDSFKCIAKSDDIIGTEHYVFKFHSRLEKTIAIHNFTRLSEDELLAALKEAKTPFVEFTCRIEVENGMEYLAIYIEQTGKMLAEKIEKAIHSYLYENDKDYRDLVDFFAYNPIKVRLVPKGTFARYLEQKIAGVAKVERIGMAEEEFEKLKQLMRGGCEGP